MEVSESRMERVNQSPGKNLAATLECNWNVSEPNPGMDSIFCVYTFLTLLRVDPRSHPIRPPPPGIPPARAPSCISSSSPCHHRHPAAPPAPPHSLPPPPPRGPRGSCPLGEWRWGRGG